MLYSTSEQLGVDPVRLSTMMPNPDLLGARRVNENDVVSPGTKNVVHVPRLTARFDGNPCAFGAGAENVLERLQFANGSSTDDEPTRHLAERGLSHAQVQGYTSHGRLLLWPLWLRL